MNHHILMNSNQKYFKRFYLIQSLNNKKYLRFEIVFWSLKKKN